MVARPHSPFAIAAASRFDRRGFLALAAGAAAAAACGSGGSQSASPPAPAGAGNATTTSTLAPVPPFRLDPDIPYWLQGNFAPVFDEVEAFDLDVRGALPPGLSGLYVRNGSNPVTGTSPHWFLGDGMLHGIRLDAGKAEVYRNRFVATPAYAARREFGSLDGGAPGRENGQSNVSVFEFGGRLFSSGEVGWPYEIDPDDLSTLGARDLAGPAGALRDNFTAHPKIDPVTGDLHAFGYGFVEPYLTSYHVGADGTLQRVETIDVAGPTMMHDFAITESDIVFFEFPVVFDLQAAVSGAAFPFAWEPSYGSRVGVMPIAGGASEVRWVEIPNQMVFHGTNAFRDGDDIVIDVSKQTSAFDPGGDLPGSLLHRWRIGTGAAELTFAAEQLDDRNMDFPRIDLSQTGREHDRAWYVTFTDTDEEGLLFRGIAGAEGGSVTSAWEPDEAQHAGEVTFVNDADRGTGGGWLLSFVYDRRTDSSSLAVLDPEDLAAGPVAEVDLPARVPFGFHGTWVEGT